jgi:hypothetical protein
MAAVLLSASAKPASISKSFHFSRLDTPPLYFPWSQIRFRKEEDGFFGKNYFYDLGTPRGGRMAIRGKMHRAIHRELQDD